MRNISKLNKNKNIESEQPMNQDEQLIFLWLFQQIKYIDMFLIRASLFYMLMLISSICFNCKIEQKKMISRLFD